MTLIRCDAPGPDRSHGYTRGDDHVFYWVYDHREGELQWRDYGYPMNHPIDPPEDVVEATEQWVETNPDQLGGDIE